MRKETFEINYFFSPTIHAVFLSSHSLAFVEESNAEDNVRIVKMEIITKLTFWHSKALGSAEPHSQLEAFGSNDDLLNSESHASSECANPSSTVLQTSISQAETEPSAFQVHG